MERDYLVLSCKQELDHHMAEILKEELKGRLQPQTKHLIFDLREATFMDSSGVGLLMARYREMQEVGGTVTVVGAGPQLNRIMTLAGLWKIIKRAETIPEALEAIQGKEEKKKNEDQ